MNKKIKVGTLCVSLIFLLSGCWSRRELNELSIATALGFDKTDDGFLVTVQIVNPSEIAGQNVTNRSEIVMYTSKGKSIFEAIRKFTTESPRKIYLAHTRSIVFGEELSREGISLTLDFLSRNHEMRTDSMIVIAKNNTANNLLKIQTDLEKVPANKIYIALETSEKSWAANKVMFLDDLINSLTTEGQHPVLTGVTVEGDVNYGASSANIENVFPKTDHKIDSIGVFKEDKLLGWLTPDQSIGYNYATNNLINAVFALDVEDGLVTIETTKSDSKIKGQVKNGKPVINLEINTEGNIGELQSNLDITKNQVISKLEKKYSENIKNIVESAIQEAQSTFKSDIFGFGDAIHRESPSDWKTLKENWDEEFANMKVNVKVNAKINDLGTITKSFQEK